MKKFEGNFLRAVTPDCDYGIDAQLARVGNNLIGNIAHNFFPVLDRAVAEGIAPVRGTEDCSATRQNAAHIFEDRKSTRLNSSHANISYAVFCLKKKKERAMSDQH